MGRERSECGDRQAARRTFSTLDSRERDKERRENDRNEWPNLALFGGEEGGERHSRTPRGETRQPRTHTYIHIYIYSRIFYSTISSTRSRYFSSIISPPPPPIYRNRGWMEKKKKGWAGSAEVVDNEDDDSKDDLTAQPVSNLMTELGPSGPPALFLPSISHARSSRDPPRIPRSEIRLSLSLSYSSR